jgi:hypothetical protein
MTKREGTPQREYLKPFGGFISAPSDNSLSYILQKVKG